MGQSRKQREKGLPSGKPVPDEIHQHDWMTPVEAGASCGPDLEYDPEFVVLSSQLAARGDTQYGAFVGVPEPVNWSDVDRDCRRLMLRSKDMRLALLFTRCRTRLAGAVGLAEGLGLLSSWLAAFPAEIHPQPDVDEDRNAALEIRMNALQTLTDTDGLLSDVREIALTRSSVVRLQVRDVERAFIHPRPNDALAPESVTRQLEDLRIQQPQTMASFDHALASLGAIETWSHEHLGVFAPDFAILSRLLRRVAGVGPAAASDETVSSATDAMSRDEYESGSREAPALEAVGEEPLLDVQRRQVTSSAAQDRNAALERIREARHWFEQHEPSSPIPVLLRQAEQLVGKRYREVVGAIPAELLAQWDSE